MQEETQETEPVEETIELTVGGKLRKVRVRNVPIEWEGKKEIVQIKKLAYGERATFAEKFMKIEIQGEHNLPTIDFTQMQVQTLVMTLIKAPFPITEDYISYELDGELGDMLYRESDKLNKFNADQKKKSDSPSITESQTQK